jgi:hypothetical protein
MTSQELQIKIQSKSAEEILADYIGDFPIPFNEQVSVNYPEILEAMEEYASLSQAKEITDEEIEKAFPVKSETTALTTEYIKTNLNCRIGAKWYRQEQVKRKEMKTKEEILTEIIGTTDHVKRGTSIHILYVLQAMEKYASQFQSVEIPTDVNDKHEYHSCQHVEKYSKRYRMDKLLLTLAERKYIMFLSKEKVSVIYLSKFMEPEELGKLIRETKDRQNIKKRIKDVTASL